MVEDAEEGHAFGSHCDPIVGWGHLTWAKVHLSPCPGPRLTTCRQVFFSERAQRVPPFLLAWGVLLAQPSGDRHSADSPWAWRWRLCPRGPLKQHHLYANSGCDPGGASWEPSQVRDMLPRRGPEACGVCPRSWQGWAEQARSTLCRGAQRGGTASGEQFAGPELCPA